MNSTVIPIRIESTPNLREHWAQRAKRAGKHKADVHVAMRAAKMPYAVPCVVTLTRIAPRTLDGDNLQAGCKAARDAVALYLAVDDADPRVEWRYGQEKGGPKEYALRVSINAPLMRTAAHQSGSTTG